MPHLLRALHIRPGPAARPKASPARSPESPGLGTGGGPDAGGQWVGAPTLKAQAGKSTEEKEEVKV